MKDVKSHEVELPSDLRNALAADPKIEAAWEGLTAIGRRDFISWIETAKKEETRARRVEIACDKLAKGQRRPCCYAVVPMDLYKVLGERADVKAKWSALSADEKRDFSDWLEESEDKPARKLRVQEICEKILAGEKSP